MAAVKGPHLRRATRSKSSELLRIEDDTRAGCTGLLLIHMTEKISIADRGHMKKALLLSINLHVAMNNLKNDLTQKSSLPWVAASGTVPFHKSSWYAYFIILHFLRLEGI